MNEQSAVPAARSGIIVGVDGSEQSLRALDRAAREAGRRGTALRILCGGVWPKRSAVPITQADQERILKQAAQVVDEAAERARRSEPDLEIVPVTEMEVSAADALVRASRTAELTVVGSRGHGGFAGLLVGSVSLRVAAHTEGPLMVVRVDHPGSLESNRGSTLVGYSSRKDESALDFGFEEAERTGSRLRVLHAWQPPRMPGVLQRPPHEDSEGAEAARSMLREVIAPHAKRHPDVEVSDEAQAGSPAAALIEASRAADAVVLSTRLRQRRLGMHIGPNAHALLHHAHCPVVMVPTENGNGGNGSNGGNGDEGSEGGSHPA
ncbi:universal stress protein [Streptomyces sp. ODS28]|uniref:universal stress protein n=1 Tax=Streptomyces sp. ODS28 TaxID=3136688 RepID=UPI0031F0ABA5